VPQQAFADLEDTVAIGAAMTDLIHHAPQQGFVGLSVHRHKTTHGRLLSSVFI
jgi:hypothetical protein